MLFQVTSHLGVEKVEPVAKLTSLRRSITPTTSVIRPLSSRDLTPKGVQMLELVSTYKFKVEFKCKLSPVYSLLQDQLYDGAWGSASWLLFDRNGLLLQMGDAYTNKVDVKEGDYTLMFQVLFETFPLGLAKKLMGLPAKRNSVLNTVNFDMF